MSTSRSFAVVVAVFMLTCFAADESLAQDQSTKSGQRGPRLMCQDRFVALDTNKDGQVDKEEFMSIQHPGGNAENVFTSRDSNGDGILTKEEFCAGKGFHGGRMQ